MWSGVEPGTAYIRKDIFNKMGTKIKLGGFKMSFVLKTRSMRIPPRMRDVEIESLPSMLAQM